MNTLKHLILSLVLAAIVSTVNAQDYNNIEFIENKGQWDSRVKFKGDVDAGSIFIRSTGFTILQYNKQDYAGVRSYLHKENSGTALKNSAGDMVIRSHAYDVDFVGASPAIQVIPDKAIPTYNNYFIGDDPSKWGSNCRIYQAVTLKDVYPNVDVRYYTDNGTLKYDIIARPGADISKIALKYNGVDKLEIKNKELVAVTSVGNLRESLPSTYQVRSNGRSEISNRYVVKDNIVRFDIKNYDRSSTLVIDPSPIFCSFSGSTATNWGFTATYGPDGSFYGGGIIFGSSSFPSPGAYQTNYQGGEFDIGIIKLSANGANRIYATYIGGSGDDQPHSLVVTPQGELILAGRTNSPLPGASNGTPYPVIGAIAGSGGGYDIVVTKLNAAGNALIGSKRIGGPGDDGVNISESRSGTNSLQRNYGDDGRSEVIIDGGGNVYVASCTQSQGTTANPSFPVTAGAFQPNTGGGTQDGVVLKLTSNLSTVSFASYLGGSGNDAAYVLTLGPTGDIYVAGGTEQGSSATDFSGNHAGTVGPSSNGSIDGFVARISNNGSSIIRSTYIGTSGVDQVYGIQFDRKGFLYVMGTTTGQWFITPGTKTFGSGGVNGKQFITKLQPDLSAYIYSTVFGTPSAAPNISPTAFLVDRCENVYVSGWGGLNDQSRAYETSGTSGLPVTADADQATTDGHDFYFFVLEKNATSQLYGSFFGQNGGRYGDHVDGGTSRFDPNGVIYQAVCANCGGGATFPTTIGAWSRVNRALPDGCNLGMVKIAFNLAGVGANVQSAIGGVPNDTAGLSSS
ncbi:MAG: SBBP repeat-containing protein [Chitinophagaceae bacterium]